MTQANYDKHKVKGTMHLLFSKLVINFETFICPMIYSSRDERKIGLYNLTKTKEDIDDEKELKKKKSIDNRDLANLKKFFEQSPLDDFEDVDNEETKRGDEAKTTLTARENLLRSREHY